VLNELAEALTRQRALLIGEVADTEANLHSIQEEREIELEEQAQEDRAAQLFAQLDDREKHEVLEIDAALCRLAEGAYGQCEGCGEDIAEARLRALPAARFCIECAREREAERPRGEEIVPSAGYVPPDLRLLSASELEAYIREQLKEDGRVDVDELRIVCRHGVVHLAGTLPSEAEHSILRRLLTDELGLEDIDDHIQIQELLWERDDQKLAKPAGQSLPGAEPYGTEDIVESLEEGVDYVPPVTPPPDEE
jgi:RNA polymerase-binding transcription factor DksA